MTRFKSWLSENWLTFVTLLSIAFGAGTGLILKNYTQQPWSKREIMYLQFPGEIFLRMVNCLILPLVVSSIVSATSNLSKSGSIGIMSFYYYIVTTILGVILSVILVQTVRPGEWNSNANLTLTDSTPSFVTSDTLLDLLRNLFPDNLLKACFTQYHTSLKKPEDLTAVPINEWDIQGEYTDGTNILGLACFSLILGFTLGKMGPTGKPLLNVFETLSDVTMMIINHLVLAAPIAVLFLIPGKILDIEDFTTMITKLGVFVLTVLTGLFMHGFVTLPLIYFLCTRSSPYKILANIWPAILTAFGTSSSSATVPMTIKCLDKIGIDPKVSRFIAPIGATINMDGIALYEALGAIFIIQLRGLHFTLARIIAISVTCTVSCIGAAGLPNGGYVMLVMVLNSVGVPAEDVTLIIAIDSLVDRFRTTINIIGDALGAGIITHCMKDDIEEGKIENGKSDTVTKLLNGNEAGDKDIDKLNGVNWESVVK